MQVRFSTTGPSLRIEAAEGSVVRTMILIAALSLRRLSNQRKSGPDALRKILRKQARAGEQLVRARRWRDGAEELQYAKRKHGSIEFFRVSAQLLLVPPETLKLFDCFGQRHAVRLIEENTSEIFFDGFDRAAAAKSNHGPAGGIRFQRRHAKILFAGKQQRAAAR